VILPLLLLLLAAVPAAVVAYGIDPDWAQYPHGIELILFSRRFEWPMIAVTLVLCVAMLGLIVAGKRRAWWLVGLAPILTLLGHRFATNPNNSFLVNSDPMFVSADRASFVAADDSVVGIIDGSDAVAFPFASLYSRPMVVRDLQTQPMMLMWSPFANCASAYRIDRSIQSNELEIVCMPANALLAYNSRVGQFINGVTGLTPDGRVPAGFISRIPSIKTSWDRWVSAHPNTMVLVPPDSGVEAPRRAVLPYFPMPADSSGAESTVALIGGSSPMAIPDADLGARDRARSGHRRGDGAGPTCRRGFDSHLFSPAVPQISRGDDDRFRQRLRLDRRWPGHRRPVEGKDVETAGNRRRRLLERRAILVQQPTGADCPAGQTGVAMIAAHNTVSHPATFSCAGHYGTPII
jgi:hypothetical protein